MSFRNVDPREKINTCLSIPVMAKNLCIESHHNIIAFHHRVYNETHFSNLFTCSMRNSGLYLGWLPNVNRMPWGIFQIISCPTFWTEVECNVYKHIVSLHCDNLYSTKGRDEWLLNSFVKNYILKKKLNVMWSVIWYLLDSKELWYLLTFSPVYFFTVVFWRIKIYAHFAHVYTYVNGRKHFYLNSVPLGYFVE